MLVRPGLVSSCVVSHQTTNTTECRADWQLFNGEMKIDKCVHAEIIGNQRI